MAASELEGSTEQEVEPTRSDPTGLEAEALAQEDPSPIDEPTGESVDEPVDAQPEPEDEDESDEQPDDSLRWQIVYGDDANPFTAQLLFSTGVEEILWLDLDPVTLRDLIGGLTLVQDTQIATITGKPVRPREALSTETTSEPTSKAAIRAQRRAERSWWARHKALSFLIFIFTIMMLVSLFTAGNRM